MALGVTTFYVNKKKLESEKTNFTKYLFRLNKNFRDGGMYEGRAETGSKVIFVMRELFLLKLSLFNVFFLVIAI